jgi:O-antigen/teichoic acid export membrane protein
MVVATIATGVLNYLSNVFIGRMLGPAQYGNFAALLAFFTTLTALTGVAQIVVTNYTARLTTNNDWAGLRGFTWLALRWLMVAGMAASAVIALGTGWLSRALQITSPESLWVLAAAMLPASLMPLGLGLLLGQQRFGLFGSAQITGATVRLASGVVLVFLGAGVAGAVASLICMSMTVDVFAFVTLPKVWQSWKERATPHLHALGGFLGYTAMGMLCYALLTSMDVLIVKSRFSPVESGLYAAVATVGKITLWIASGLAILLLPKVAERRVLGQDTLPLLRAVQMAVLGLCGSGTLLFFLAGPWVMRVLFGEQYLALAYLLGPYGLAMMLFALAGLLLYYFLAMEQTAYIWILAAGAVLQPIALYILASDVRSIVFGLVGAGLGLVLAGEILLQLKPIGGKQVNRGLGEP